MVFLKCCVDGCNSTSASHRMFSFPMNDYLRNLWMSFLVPRCSRLLTLNKDQLHHKRVCERHFDEHQFDQNGKRLRFSYPCLFSEQEIAHGVPLETSGCNVSAEHNYFSVENENSNGETDSMVVIKRAGEDHHYTTLNVNLHPLADAVENIKGSEQPSCSFGKDIQDPAESSVKVLAPCSTKRKLSVQAKPSAPMKKFSSKKRKFVKHIIHVTNQSLGSSSTERLNKANSMSQNVHIMDKFKELGKQAQTFLLCQLNQVRKHTLARRYTLDHSIKHLQAKVSTWTTKKKLCTITFDEISLTPHLTYDSKKDEINGFVDIGDEKRMKFCDHALVFMIRGICRSWRQSIAYYFCEGTISAADLKCILEKIVNAVGATGLIPMGLICDQGSTFRTALKLLKKDTIRLRDMEKVKDDCSVIISGHHLSIFFDPPHLLKSIRNNLLTKDMIFKDKIASWRDIEYIYDLDCKLGHTRALPKLSDIHINPKKMKKMKVSVAAQVLSERTAAMLKFTYAVGKFQDSSMLVTAEAVEFFDQLFDSVNGCPGGSKRGKLRKAIKMDSQHQSFWRDAIGIIKNIKCKDISSKMAIQSGNPRLVRVPCLDGWVTTLESFLRISKLLFEKYNVEYFYPRNINQDPLENFFGRIRAQNYRNVNPDANTFIYAFKSLYNLVYPNESFLILYRRISQLIHDYLNSNLHRKSLKENIKNIIASTMEFSWLGCGLHKILCQKIAFEAIVKLHIFNYCNLINKIFKGAIEQKHVQGMGMPQKMALNKHVKLSRNKTKK